jgi:hypothetical protein
MLGTSLESNDEESNRLVTRAGAPFILCSQPDDKKSFS